MAFVALDAIAYLVFSLVRYDQFAHSGFDLGIFDQVVWHYSRFEAPSSSVKDLDYIWGDHFSPILALLYWIWEDTRMLLIAQALLLAAAAAVPIFLLVRAKLGRVAAYVFALSYLAFWGLQSALSFEFHELVFAPLLIALVLLAIERRRWGAYFPLLIALLCVKAAAQGATTELSKRSAALQEILAKDATGYVTRFAALCSPSSPPGQPVS